MKSNDCKLFGGVNIASFINVKKKLQVGFVSVDTMSSMNVEVVKQIASFVSPNFEGPSNAWKEL